MWEANAEYADGTTVQRFFACNENVGEKEQQYNIERWLIERHPDCIWYSVNGCPDFYVGRCEIEDCLESFEGNVANFADFNQGEVYKTG